MNESVTFSEAHYRSVLDEFGYQGFEIRHFDSPLGGLDVDTLNARYLCHHRGRAFSNSASSERTITTGFGMSGVPHLATVSHILKMIEFQRNGERCQIVLGDLDAYNGKRRPHSEVQDLCARFHEFAISLGFDHNAGVLRSQAGDATALETMYLLGRYIEQSDFSDVEEDNHSYYVARGLVDEKMTFRRALSLTLMAADFIALGQKYESVLVVLGIDEHRYVRFTRQIADRLDRDVPLRSEFELCSAYTRMIRGFGGHPKFSKSIPGSAIDVRTEPGRVHALLDAEPSIPEDSATFQLMCQMPHYDAAALTDLREHCRCRDGKWRREVLEFTEYVNNLIALWPR